MVVKIFISVTFLIVYTLIYLESIAATFSVAKVADAEASISTQNIGSYTNFYDGIIIMNRPTSEGRFSPTGARLLRVTQKVSSNSIHTLLLADANKNRRAETLRSLKQISAVSAIPNALSQHTVSGEIAALQFPPPFEVAAVGFQMMPCEVLDESRNAHPPFSQPADDFIQSVAYLAAHEDGLAVLDFRHSEKRLSVFLQCRSLLSHSDTVGYALRRLFCRYGRICRLCYFSLHIRFTRYTLCH